MCFNHYKRREIKNKYNDLTSEEVEEIGNEIIAVYTGVVT